MWWAVGGVTTACGPSKTVGVWFAALNPALGPTQMAIPLQMESVPKQLVAATRARKRVQIRMRNLRSRP